MSSLPPSKSKIPTVKTIISTIGSVAAAAMVARSIARDYLPPELQEYLSFGLRSFINKMSGQLTMVIHEYDGSCVNEIYYAAEDYLAARSISPDIERLKVSKTSSDKNIKVSMEINESFSDVYNGVKFNWSFNSKKKPVSKVRDGDSSSSDKRWFELTFHFNHRDLAVNDYLPFVINDSKARKLKERTVMLFTVKTGAAKWKPVNLDHPSTFDTLAMDSDVKEKVIKDLDKFVERGEYYRKIGKAWKRGYLLYGPPGTGKSSLIAAMANYLKFDIYDLELTAIRSNSELRKLLMHTANRSILVVEDIDCSAELHDRADADQPAIAPSWMGSGYNQEKKVTLSGFLNFIDGLCSSCGDERIIVFTTNKKDKLDPALLRPGRMDVHINMSYCTPCGFRLLASNYLGINQHDRFKEIEVLIGEVEITPAEVAEQLLKDGDPDIALGGLVEFFKVKRKENEEAKAKELEKVKELVKAKEPEKVKELANEQEEFDSAKESDEKL